MEEKHSCWDGISDDDYLPIELIYFDSPWSDVHFTLKVLVKSGLKFFVMFFAAYEVYKRVLKPILRKFPRLGKRRVGFQDANSMIVLFLGCMWAYFLMVLS